MLLFAAWFMEDPSDYSLGLPKWYMDTTKLTCLKKETPFPNHHLLVDKKKYVKFQKFSHVYSTIWYDPSDPSDIEA